MKTAKWKSRMNFEEANRLFTYDPFTGEIKWSENRTDLIHQKENHFAKHAGKKAGCEYRHRNTKYIRITADGVRCYAHQIAWLLCWEEWPKGQIDHRDGNGLNNRISNLRDVSGSLNQRNMVFRKSKLHPGVYRNPSGTFSVKIGDQGKQIHIGTFNTPEEAVAARKLEQEKRGYSARHGSVNRSQEVPDGST